MNVNVIKTGIIESVSKFLDHGVSGFSNIGFKTIYQKIKPKIMNKLTKDIDKFVKYIDFICDEKGNIDYDLYDSFIEAMKTMPRKEYDMDFLSIIIENATIKLQVPDNIFSDLFCGGTTAITFKDADFIELRNILQTNIKQI